MYSVNILMFKFSKLSNKKFSKAHCMIAMDEEKGTELNELQRLKPTHELLYFALLPSQMH